MAAVHFIKWSHVGSGEYTGVGEHSRYKIHRLTTNDIGIGPHPMFGKDGKWMVARSIGQNPFKVIGGPYDTADAAKRRAERLEAAL